MDTGRLFEAIGNERHHREKEKHRESRYPGWGSSTIFSNCGVCIDNSCHSRADFLDCDSLFVIRFFDDGTNVRREIIRNAQGLSPFVAVEPNAFEQGVKARVRT